MIFTPAGLDGAYLVDIDPHRDERGFFARTWCRDEADLTGLVPDFDQCSISFNNRRGTLRGMHYQADPDGEVKVVRCTAGKIFDVIVDVRPGSGTYKQWVGVELSVENRRALYIPVGVAHGFLTLTDNCEVSYWISGRFIPESARGIRWNDPHIGIAWPFDPNLISDRDATFPDWESIGSTTCINAD